MSANVSTVGLESATISHNDRMFLWAHSDHNIFLCGRYIFVLSDSESGNLDFVEMEKSEDKRMT